MGQDCAGRDVMVRLKSVSKVLCSLSTLPCTCELYGRLLYILIPLASHSYPTMPLNSGPLSHCITCGDPKYEKSFVDNMCATVALFLSAVNVRMQNFEKASIRVSTW